MLRSRNKLTGETKMHSPQKEDNVPEPKEGDCRECAFYRPPLSTGQSEDLRFMTDNWRRRPCGQGLCIGKKFMTRDDLAKIQSDEPKPKVEPDPKPKPTKKKPVKKKKPIKKTDSQAGDKPTGDDPQA